MAVSASSSRAEPKSAHVSDASVQPFLQDEFDPADYLNNALPGLSVSSTNRGNQYGRSVPLPELSTQLQTLLTQLNAQTSRLSTALTQLTDEIIRSVGRLSYEVELLRGETIGLKDSLDNGLRKDVELFVPPKDARDSTNDETGVRNESEKAASSEPEYLAQLKTLTQVRERLDTVIKVFGDAMQWPLAPRDMSLTSSLISVSAPDDDRDREEKGKAYVERLRTEINTLIGSGNDVASLEEAAARIDELRHLAEVWRGTAEEKARLKLVENLQKPVEERIKALEQSRKPTGPARGVDLRYGSMNDARIVSEGGYGFLQNLRNLRNDVYLE